MLSRVWLFATLWTCSHAVKQAEMGAWFPEMRTVDLGRGCLQGTWKEILSPLNWIKLIFPPFPPWSPGCVFSKWYFRSVRSLSRVWLFATPWTTQLARPLCPSPTPGVHSDSGPLSQWCHPTISSSVVPFSSCPQSFPASVSSQMSQLFASGSQSIGVSASASFLPMNTQDWFPLGWTGWISLQSKGLSRVFSNTTVQKHRSFSAQPSLWSSSHIRTWPQEKPQPWPDGPLLAFSSPPPTPPKRRKRKRSKSYLFF